MILKEERETILNYDPMTQTWYAWTNIPAHIRRFERLGWECTKSFRDGGVEVAKNFMAPKNAMTFRNLYKIRSPKNHAEEAVFEEEQDEDE